MKCKICGAELICNCPWWDCPNCKTYWKLVGITEEGILLLPYKELPNGDKILEHLKEEL